MKWWSTNSQLPHLKQLASKCLRISATSASSKRCFSNASLILTELRMLKVLTGKGILCLTPVCQVAWKFGKTPRDWQTGVIIPILKKGDRKQCVTAKGYHS